MTVKSSKLTFLFSALSLASCGGGSGSDSPTQSSNPTPTTPTATNTAPTCTASSLSFNRGMGEQSLLSALSCSDSDNDPLSYGNSDVNTDGKATGEYQQNVTVSDGQGNTITVAVDYVIANQAPQCEQAEQPRAC